MKFLTSLALLATLGASSSWAFKCDATVNERGESFVYHVTVDPKVGGEISFRGIADEVIGKILTQATPHRNDLVRCFDLSANNGEECMERILGADWESDAFMAERMAFSLYLFKMVENAPISFDVDKIASGRFFVGNTQGMFGNLSMAEYFDDGGNLLGRVLNIGIPLECIE